MLSSRHFLPFRFCKQGMIYRKTSAGIASFLASDYESLASCKVRPNPCSFAVLSASI